MTMQARKFDVPYFEPSEDDPDMIGPRRIGEAEPAPLPEAEETPSPAHLPVTTPNRRAEVPRRRSVFGRLTFLVSGIATGAIVVVLVGLYILARPAAVQTAATTAAPAIIVPMVKAPSITVVAATHGPISETVVVTGNLVPREEVLVAPQIDGYAIDQILVEEGDSVKQGQVLARLSHEMIDVSLAQNTASIAQYDASIAQAQASIAQALAGQVQAASAYARSQELSRSGNVTSDTLDQRKAAAQQADAQLDSARQALKLAQANKAFGEAQRDELMVRLARTEIKAPASGIISRRTARIGAIASAAGDPLFRIIEDGAVELEGQVPEATLAHLQPGMTADVTTAARDQPFKAHVRLVSPEVDATTRLGKVRLAIDSEPGLTVGAFGRASVMIASREGLVVPQSAVLYSENGPSVQVVKDGVVATHPVTIGLRTEREAEITKGLAVGDDVVATAGTFVNDGDHVTPVVGGATAAQ